MEAAPIQEAGCRVLKELAAYHTANQHAILSLGGIQAVLDAYRLFKFWEKKRAIPCSSEEGPQRTEFSGRFGFSGFVGFVSKQFKKLAKQRVLENDPLEFPRAQLPRNLTYSKFE